MKDFYALCLTIIKKEETKFDIYLNKKKLFNLNENKTKTQHEKLY